MSNENKIAIREPSAHCLDISRWKASYSSGIAINERLIRPIHLQPGTGSISHKTRKSKTKILAFSWLGVDNKETHARHARMAVRSDVCMGIHVASLTQHRTTTRTEKPKTRPAGGVIVDGSG
jgi:hypothetical protein